MKTNDFDLQFFAGEAPAPAPAPAPEIPKVDGQPAAKTFTQAELDGHIEERLQRERKKYADYETLKERVAKLDALEKAKPPVNQPEKPIDPAQAQYQKLQADMEELRKTIADQAANLKAKDRDLRLERDFAEYPASQRERLKKLVEGETEADIVASIASVKKDFPAPAVLPGAIGGPSNPITAAKKTAQDEAIAYAKRMAEEKGKRNVMPDKFKLL